MDRSAQAQAQRFTTFASELSRYYLEILVMAGFGLIAGVVIATSDDSTTGLATLAVLAGCGLPDAAFACLGSSPPSPT